MKKTFASVPLLIASFLGLTAASLAAGWDDGAPANWKALLEKAKTEGPVVIAGCPENTPFLAKAFKADTGLDVSLVVGDALDVQNRFRAEAVSGRTTIDIRLGGPNEVDLAKSGNLLPVNSLFLLPDVLNKDRWIGGNIHYVDKTQKFMAIPSEYVSTRPVINSELINPSSVKTLKDLLKPEFKGKIASFDPRINSSGLAVAAYIAEIYGVDFVKKLYKDQGVVVSTDQRQLAEWGARGVYPIIIGMDPLFVQRFQESGVKSLMIITPEDAPGSLNGGCSVPELPNALPHPAATQVFINWYLSSAGQKAFVEVSHLPSMRSDVPPIGVPDYIKPDPKVTYLDQYEEDWNLIKRPLVRDQLKTVIDN